MKSFQELYENILKNLKEINWDDEYVYWELERIKREWDQGKILSKTDLGSYGVKMFDLQSDLAHDMSDLSHIVRRKYIMDHIERAKKIKQGLTPPENDFD